MPRFVRVDDLDNVTPRFRGDIQGLRAVAVVLVILAHAGVPGMAGGFLGVDVFFVISGFVITGVLWREQHRKIRDYLSWFYSRRVRRLIPAATVTLVATVLGTYFLTRPHFDATLLGDVRWSAFFAENIHLIRDSAGYFMAGVIPSPVTHFWSLAVEEQFYLLFPLVVFLSTRSSSKTVRIATLVTVLIAGLEASAFWSWHETLVNPVTAYYEPFTRFGELALGALVALIPTVVTRRAPTANSVLAFCAAVALGLAVWRLGPTSVFPGVLVWWPACATAVLLAVGARQIRGGLASVLAWRPIRYVGDISYGLYLWHFPWLIVPALMTHPYTGARDRLIEVAGATLCSVMSFHLIEQPIRRSRSLDRDRLAVAILLILCLAISLAVTIVVGRFVGA